MIHCSEEKKAKAIGNLFVARADHTQKKLNVSVKSTGF
jgi:hypothetical protein